LTEKLSRSSHSEKSFQRSRFKCCNSFLFRIVEDHLALFLEGVILWT